MTSLTSGYSETPLPVDEIDALLQVLTDELNTLGEEIPIRLTT